MNAMDYLNAVYGEMPAPPRELLFESLSHTLPVCLEEAHTLWAYRIHCLQDGKRISFSVHLLLPRAEEKFPVVISGDGMGWQIPDAAAKCFLGRGYGFVFFNRTELAEDLGYSGVRDPHARDGGLYDFSPGGTFGALSAWAWGFHRCVDFLHSLFRVDAGRIAVTGHSRGGKAALLAGATDSRIGIVSHNGSGAGGGSLFHQLDAGSEGADILERFPSWFGKHARALLPGIKPEFDQDVVVALVAPRPQLLTYSVDDLWSNPGGMVACAGAAQKTYRRLNQPGHLVYHLRRGPHGQTGEDWRVLLDFLEWKWAGKPPEALYNQHPDAHDGAVT